MRGRYWQVIYRDKVTICDDDSNLEEKLEFIHKDEQGYHTHILFKFKSPVDLLKTFKAKNDVINIVRIRNFDCWKKYLKCNAGYVHRPRVSRGLYGPTYRGSGKR